MKNVKPMIAAASLILASATTSASAAEAKCHKLPDTKIGVQLFAMMNYMNQGGAGPAGARSISLARTEETFKALRSIGYRNVERFGGTFSASAADYQRIAKATGIAVSGSHDNLNMETWNGVLDIAKALGQRYVGSGGYGAPGLDSLENVLATSRNLNKLGEAAAKRGLRLYTHNHANEFSKKYPYDLNKDGTPEQVSAWEIIAAETDPRYVSFEVDIHWARVGIGLNDFDGLLHILTKYRNRIVMLHVKDTSADGKITDLGAGTTDWPAVFKASGNRIAYYFWEYDGAPDPIKSAGIAYRFMRCQS